MQDQDYMQRAITLAKRGEGWTSPNPLVGAVIVKDGRVIGEGWHRRYGDLHAEREAFASLRESAQGATIYVTLEPCCHHGHQPPCTEAILEHGIARVVIGSRDPNPLVAGKGVALLKEKGLEVTEDFMRGECDALNPIFFHYITTGLPYVTMKYAMTADGKIATKTGASRWITGETARAHVHNLRGRYSAILAGIGTVQEDDPMLNCRIEGAHQPVRIVADSRLRISQDSQLVRTADRIRTVVACALPENGGESEADEELRKREVLLKKRGVEVWHIPDASGKVDLWELIRHLGRQKIDSLFIEGGGEIHEAALRAGIVNHVCAYIAPKLFGGSLAKSPVEGEGVEFPQEGATLEHLNLTMLGEDLLLEYDIKGGMKGVYRNC